VLQVLFNDRIKYDAHAHQIPSLLNPPERWHLIRPAQILILGQRVSALRKSPLRLLRRPQFP